MAQELEWPCELIVCDLEDPAQRAKLAEAAAECEVLVNNAGIAESAPLGTTTDTLWRRTLDINLTVPFELTRAALPKMMRRGWGRVIHIASTAAIKGYAYTAAYSASKGGLAALTRVAALEGARHGVTVNAICPGFTDTAMTEASALRVSETTGRGAAEARRMLEGFSPQRRFMTPAEIGALTAFLVSHQARGINGQCICVDGGETA